MIFLFVLYLAVVVFCLLLAKSNRVEKINEARRDHNEQHYYTRNKPKFVPPELSVRKDTLWAIFWPLSIFQIIFQFFKWLFS